MLDLVLCVFAVSYISTMYIIRFGALVKKFILPLKMQLCLLIFIADSILLLCSIFIMFLQSVLSNGFLFALVWDPVENSYINPNEYKATRIDFNKERGKVRAKKSL